MDALAPIVNSLNAPFWEGARSGALMLPFCVATGRAFWPPSPWSPFHANGAVAWRRVEPVGTLVSRVVYRRSFHPALAPLMPYAIALVTLDAGARLQAHLARPDDPESPRAGERVALRFLPLIEGGPAVPTVEKLP